MQTNKVQHYAELKAELGLSMIPWKRSIHSETKEELQWYFCWINGNKIIIHLDEYNKITNDIPVTLIHKCDCEKEDGSSFSTYIMYTCESAK